ncbi:MAG: desulfoferrodoxin [Candidatus Saccharicenans sp.]|nr:desulfoferrodoxin [Candidatus Saccharicenans sp.]
MAKKYGIYKCLKCGNIVEVLAEGRGTLVCCGEDMVFLEARTADTSQEKHVPYIERVPGGYLVKVGQNVAHPMEERHYIEWIELLVDGKVYRQELKPGDKPEAFFKVEGNKVWAREYCNIHLLWENRN